MLLPDLLADPRVHEAIDRAIEEDVDPGIQATGEILARQACRVAGGGVAAAELKRIDPSIVCETIVPDGCEAPIGGPILRFRGPAAAILTGERTALNFMQRMCGIATLTRRFVAAVREFGTQVLDTRKTTPGLRLFEKYSVRCGGGVNHRFALYDRILMKDNHRRLWAGNDPDRLDLAVQAARERFPNLVVEVEVETIQELQSALRARPEWVLLDNMSCEMMAECVKLAKGISLTEASGGITLERARDVAATGVDALSLGCLTHSAPAVDLALEWSVV